MTIEGGYYGYNVSQHLEVEVQVVEDSTVENSHVEDSHVENSQVESSPSSSGLNPVQPINLVEVPTKCVYLCI